MEQTILQEIYGEKAGAQRERYTAIHNHFLSLYGPGPVQFFRAPGRVNLIGEHTDYNQGYVMPVAIDRDVLLAMRPRSDNRLRFANIEPQFEPFTIAIQPDIPRGEAGDWRNFVQGVAQTMAQTLQRPLLGFDALVSAEAPFGVPRGAGLSSSSALTVVTAVALAHLNQWQPETAEFVQFCSDSEWYVGTRGGMMDQFISLLGQKGQALFLDCRPGFHNELVPLPTDVAVLVINSGVKHQNTSGHFNRRVAACRAGVGLLQKPFPQVQALRDLEDIPWSQIEPHLPTSITVAELKQQGVNLDDLPGIRADVSLKVRARCRHVWSENGRVLQAKAAMQTQDVARLGQLLQEAHASARDDYEISCQEVETLVAILQAQSGVTGARLTGAGWGGCVVALVEQERVTAVAQQTIQQYVATTQIQANAFICQPGVGAGLVLHT